MPPSDPSDPPSLEHVESQQPNLSVLFNKCVYGFAEVLRIISAGQTQPVIGADAPVISPAELDRAFDEYGRLKVWGHDFRASLPDLTRSSLGETLHRHGELRDQVASIFLLLDKEITSVLDLLSRGDYASSIVDDQALGDNDHSSSNSDSGSDSESDISGTDDNPRHGPKRSIISRRMAAVFDQIKLLYYLGILLQRPGLSRKYLKSGSNTLDATSEDISHVWETIKRWQKEPDQHVGIDPVDEKAVTREEIQRRTKSSMGAGGVSTQLIERLARANTRRREQLAYWSEHPDQTFAQNVDEVQVPDRPAQHYSAKKAKSVISTGTSLFSKNTVAFSDIAGVSSLRQSDDGPARTIYEETVVGGTHSSRVPSVPEESNFGDTFECPYCHLQLDSALMRGNRHTWKRHVFRDLRPYTCTYASCPSGDKLYATKHDWMYHEMQVHRRQWSCGDCDVTLFFQDDMALHLTSAHSGSWGSGQLPVVLELHERPLDDARPSQCPFCPMSSRVKSLLEHLGRHMEELSLFVLPCPADDENGYESASTSTPDKESGSLADVAEKTTGMKSLKVLTAQLEDLDWHARVDAIDALSRRSALPEAILQAIAAGLGDQDVRVRCAAVNALGRQPALPGEMLKALIDLQEMLQASVDLPLGHENPEGSKDGEVASNFLTAPDTNKGVELGDKEDDAGFTVVKTRQKQRLKPNEREVPNRCVWRMYCREGIHCKYGHTKEERDSFMVFGKREAVRYKLCPDRDCFKRKCRYAHTVDELFCPTCGKTGAHEMRDCPDNTFYGRREKAKEGAGPCT